MRRKGIGQELLRKTEKLTRSWGYNLIRLQPLPLSKGITKDRLINWYTNNGYIKKHDIFFKYLD